MYEILLVVYLLVAMAVIGQWCSRVKVQRQGHVFRCRRIQHRLSVRQVQVTS